MVMGQRTSPQDLEKEAGRMPSDQCNGDGNWGKKERTNETNGKPGEWQLTNAIWVG
jgi:hypothetical protein